jgi:hypothetical protein
MTNKLDAPIRDAITKRAKQYTLEGALHETLLDARLLCKENGLNFHTLCADSAQLYDETVESTTAEQLTADYKTKADMETRINLRLSQLVGALAKLQLPRKSLAERKRSGKLGAKST